MRFTFILAAAVALVACGAEDEGKAPVDEAALDGLAFEPGKADGAGPFRGEIGLDAPVHGALDRAAPYHLYELEIGGEAEVFIDLASRGGDDVYLLLYHRDRGPWRLIDRNDDCAPYTLNACLEVTLAPGRYLVGATTYAFAARNRRVAAHYELTVHCRGGACGRDVLCGSRGLAPCAEGQYCDFADDACGAADGPGVCRPRPEACIQVYQPVCGCDGQTYGNACSAASAGVDVASEGACPDLGQDEGETCGGIATLQCAPDLECDYSANESCDIADMGGVCVSDEPVFCTMEYAPVCGCDGQTYSNDCFRRVARVALDHRGACR